LSRLKLVSEAGEQELMIYRESLTRQGILLQKPIFKMAGRGEKSGFTKNLSACSGKCKTTKLFLSSIA
jgi:hypothetical protein